MPLSKSVNLWCGPSRRVLARRALGVGRGLILNGFPLRILQILFSSTTIVLAKQRIVLWTQTVEETANNEAAQRLDWMMWWDFEVDLLHISSNYYIPTKCDEWVDGTLTHLASAQKNVSKFGSVLVSLVNTKTNREKERCQAKEFIYM